jgi:hypothetical protein
MKVKLQRDHLDSNKGDTIEVTEERANYFARTGVIEQGEASESKEPKKDEVAANVEILSDIVDNETKEALVEDASKEGIEIPSTEAPAEVKEEKATRTTKEDKEASKRSTK